MLNAFKSMTLRKLHENIQLVLSGLVLLSFLVLSLIYKSQFQWRSSLIIFTAAILLFICIATYVKKGLLFKKKGVNPLPTLAQPIKDWLPLLVIIIIYENLREFTGVINPKPIDSYLHHIDLLIFGMEPVLWAQQYVTPLLTDVFSLFYASYFLLPLILAFHLYWKNEKENFREFSLSIGLCLYIGFILYIVFPAGPPRFYFDTAFWSSYPQLEGKWGIYELFHMLSDGHNPVVHYASFPSLHVGLAVVSLVYSIRFRSVCRGKIAWPLLFSFFTLGIILSTLYLRHHWFPDILAGIALAVTVVTLAYFILRLSEMLKNYSSTATFYEKNKSY